MLAERQIAVLAKLGGDKRGRIPTFEGERRRLDTVLQMVERKVYPRAQAELIAALGLGG